MQHFKSLLSPLSAAAILCLSVSATSVVNAKTQTTLWQQQDKNSKVKLDHSAWDALLKKYIVTSKQNVNFFNYAKVSKSDKTALKVYINSLKGQNPNKLSRPQQLPYWINLYNALTVKLILDNYPVKSIRKLGSGFFSKGPWDDELVNINGKTLSLNDIEHQILRPIWQDPRIHYTVNCASFSCPNLATTAYTLDNTQQLMDQGAKDYINSTRGVSVQGTDLTASSIYKWYQTDFGGNEQSLLKHLKQYASPALKQQLEGFSGDIDYTYDWSLNEPK